MAGAHGVDPYAFAVAGADEIWLPLVDEPLGSIVDDIQREHPEIASLVDSPHRILAFRTFAYIRVGLVLGQLLLEHEGDPRPTPDGTWVEALLANPEHRAALVAEVRAVAEEIAADSRYADEEPLGPDEDARARFREFARRRLNSS